MSLVIDTSHWPVCNTPLQVVWPVPGNPAHLHSFHRITDWLEFLRELDLHAAIPVPTASKYERAQKLCAYTWLESDFSKAYELVALAALEGALLDCYGRKVIEFRKCKVKQQGKDFVKISSTEKLKLAKPPMFAELMSYLVEEDGLTDERLAFAQRYQAPAVRFLYETEAARLKRNADARKAIEDPSQLAADEPIVLATIRNRLAHGDSIEGWPWGGLLELIRDLIEYAYRERIQFYPGAIAG
ncbi:hypothetical protein [Dyella tabacisoli]|uniref:Uncharacterized protein n=1 Tax=Dyella tabacisoli TaxID=2282381 RepID=A0A369UHZ1_9GAMM|nr:hypothetical protein [Dyella tabacisoli]RDD80107.1 hypothetical protein DVJ77_18345 [Dyella tabacisoli]